VELLDFDLSRDFCVAILTENCFGISFTGTHNRYIILCRTVHKIMNEQQKERIKEEQYAIHRRTFAPARQ